VLVGFAELVEPRRDELERKPRPVRCELAVIEFFLVIERYLFLVELGLAFFVGDGARDGYDSGDTA
jgi:hypothetical protein